MARLNNRSLAALMRTIVDVANQPKGKDTYTRQRADSPNELPYWGMNQSGYGLLPGYVMEVSNFNAGNGKFTIERPTGDDLASVGVTRNRCSYQGKPVGLTFDGTHELWVDPDALGTAAGDLYGSTEDSFMVSHPGTGFKAYGAPVLTPPLNAGTKNWVNTTGNEWLIPASATPAEVFINEIEATEGTLGSLASGEYFYDPDTMELTIYSATDPSIGDGDYVQWTAYKVKASFAGGEDSGTDPTWISGTVSGAVDLAADSSISISASSIMQPRGGAWSVTAVEPTSVSILFESIGTYADGKSILAMWSESGGWIYAGGDAPECP